jgi:hypothetical protein
VSNGKLSAYRVLPNLVNFDLSLAKTTTDYNKANNCREIPSNGKPKPVNSNGTNNKNNTDGYLEAPIADNIFSNVWVWVIGILLLIGLIALIVYLVKKSKTPVAVASAPIVETPAVAPPITPVYRY